MFYIIDTLAVAHASTNEDPLAFHSLLVLRPVDKPLPIIYADGAVRPKEPL